MNTDLPPARPKHQWLVQIYPGRRAVLVQAKPHKLSSAEAAIEKLKAGHRVYVTRADAPRVAWEMRRALEGNGAMKRPQGYGGR